MKETTKDFHLGDVLTIITHRLVSPNGIGGVRKLLDFMIGDYISIVCAMERCKPYLLEQFPQFTSSVIDNMIDEINVISEMSGEGEEQKLVNEWLARQVAKYGEKLSVKTI